MSKKIEYCPFDIELLEEEDEYFGFSLNEENPLYLGYDGTVLHNSGKSVCLNNLIGHCSHFSDNFQILGIDLKQVEFNMLKGVKSVKGIALDVPSAYEICVSANKIMAKRQLFCVQQGVNNIYKVSSDTIVDYYEIMGQSLQFDEIVQVWVDGNPKDKYYQSRLEVYPDGRFPSIMTIEDLYTNLQEGSLANPQLDERKGYNSYITKDDIVKTTGKFKVKANMIIVDETTQLMNSDDYCIMDIKRIFGSICRLGRALATHAVFAMQSYSMGVINADILNNIGLRMIFNRIDSTQGSNLFDRDVSKYATGSRVGRAVAKSGDNLFVFQGYYMDECTDWVFDEDMKVTYSNNDYLKGMSKKKLEPDETGFVPQIPKTPSNKEIENHTNDTKVNYPKANKKEEVKENLLKGLSFITSGGRTLTHGTKINQAKDDSIVNFRILQDEDLEDDEDNEFTEDE